MPGVPIEAVEIDMTGDLLTIRGRSVMGGNGNRAVLWNEYQEGGYYRQFNLSEAVDRNKINATIKKWRPPGCVAEDRNGKTTESLGQTFVIFLSASRRNDSRKARSKAKCRLYSAKGILVVGSGRSRGVTIIVHQFPDEMRPTY